MQRAEGLEGNLGRSQGPKFAKALREWLQPKRGAAGSGGALGSMWSEVERLHRQSGPRQPITFRYKLLLHALLAGGRASANTVMRVRLFCCPHAPSPTQAAQNLVWYCCKHVHAHASLLMPSHSPSHPGSSKSSLEQQGKLDAGLGSSCA